MLDVNKVQQMIDRSSDPDEAAATLLYQVILKNFSTKNGWDFTSMMHCLCDGFTPEECTRFARAAMAHCGMA